MEKILLLLLILLSGSTKGSIGSIGSLNINEYINNLEIDAKYTKDKIRLARKLAPMVPEEYIHPVNRSIFITESVINIFELKDYMDRNRTSSLLQAQGEPLYFEDNRERVGKILSVIQEEVPRSNMQNLGSVLEFIVDLEKYKKMFDMINTLMASQNMSNDPETLIKMVEPMMKNKGAESSMDIDKLMTIMNILNKPKDTSKTSPKQNVDLSKDTPIQGQTLDENPPHTYPSSEDIDEIDEEVLETQDSSLRPE